MVCVVLIGLYIYKGWVPRTRVRAVSREPVPYLGTPTVSRNRTPTLPFSIYQRCASIDCDCRLDALNGDLK